MTKLLVPCQIAASNSLCAYLSTVMPDVVFESTWPDPEKSLPVKAITLIPAGPRNLVFMQSPQLISFTELFPPDPILKLYRYRIAECEQPFQMDVWSQFAADRDDMVARLDQYINVGFSELPGLTGVDPADQNISLAMADGWEGSNAYFTFDTVSYDDTPDQVTRREYRATYKGMGYFNLSTTASSSTIAQINIQTQISNTDNTTFTTP